MRALITRADGSEVWIEGELTGMCPKGHACYLLTVPFPVDRDDPPGITIDLDALPDHSHVDIVGTFVDDGKTRVRLNGLRLVGLVLAIANFALAAIACLFMLWAEAVAHGFLGVVGLTGARLIELHQRRLG